MCRADKSVNVITAITIFHLLSIGCYITSIVGNKWWIIEKNGNTETQGLYKHCTDVTGSNKCITRTNILQFQDKKGTDPILMCTILSTFFILLSLTCLSSTICCCKKKLNMRKKVFKYTIILTLISVICIVDGMLYAEIEFRDEFRESNRLKGWSYLVSWIGAGFQVITFILTICLLWIRPKHQLIGY